MLVRNRLKNFGICESRLIDNKRRCVVLLLICSAHMFIVKFLVLFRLCVWQGASAALVADPPATNHTLTQPPDLKGINLFTNQIRGASAATILIDLIVSRTKDSLRFLYVHSIWAIMLVLGFKNVENRSTSLRALPRVDCVTASDFRQQYDGNNALPQKGSHTHEWIVIITSKVSPTQDELIQCKQDCISAYGDSHGTRLFETIVSHYRTRWPKQAAVGLIKVSQLVEASRELKEVLPWYHFGHMAWFCTASIVFSTPIFFESGVMTLSRVSTRFPKVRDQLYSVMQNEAVKAIANDVESR